MKKRMLLFLLCSLLVLPTAWGTVSQAAGDSAGQFGLVQWAVPELAFEDDSASVYGWPTVIADAAGRPHVFVGGGATSTLSAALWHTERGEGGQWTPELDIFAPLDGSPYGQPRVVLDALGRFQLIWGSTGYSPQYWSFAQSSRADSAQAWQAPTAISHDAAFMADLAIDRSGALNVVYAVTGVRATGLPSVYYTRKEADSSAWSAPILVAPANVERGIADVRLAIDGTGCVHVVWQEGLLTGYPPTGIYYSRSCSAGRTWTEPIMVFGPDVGNPRIVIVGNDEVHVVSLGRVHLPGRYHRWSADRGDTWSRMNTIAPTFDGLSGTGLAVDSAGVVHWILVSSDKRTLWHTAWVNENWTPLSRIAGPIPPSEGTGYEFPQLTIVNGNHLLVVFLEWREETANTALSKVFLLEGHTESPYVPSPPEVQSVPVPTTKAQPTPPQERQTTAAPAMNEGAGVLVAPSTPPVIGSTSFPLIVALMSVMVVLASAIVYARIRR